MVPLRRLLGLSLADTLEVMMRNPLQFVAVIRNFVVLANVAILAVERFAVSIKPEISHSDFTGTGRVTWPGRCRGADGPSKRRGYAMAGVLPNDFGLMVPARCLLPVRSSSARRG